jgi:hypothetical protein
MIASVFAAMISASGSRLRWAKAASAATDHIAAIATMTATSAAPRALNLFRPTCGLPLLFADVRTPRCSEFAPLSPR